MLFKDHLVFLLHRLTLAPLYNTWPLLSSAFFKCFFLIETLRHEKKKKNPRAGGGGGREELLGLNRGAVRAIGGDALVTGD